MTRRVPRIAALTAVAVLVVAVSAFAYFRAAATASQPVSAATIGQYVAAASPTSPYPSVCPGGYAAKIDNSGPAAQGTGDAIQVHFGSDPQWAGPRTFACTISLQAQGDLPGDGAGPDPATVTLSPSGGFTAQLRDTAGNATNQIGQGQSRRIDITVPNDAPTTSGTLRIDLDFEDGTRMHYTIDVGWTNT